VDTITDFRPQDDTIQLENRIFKALKKAGSLKKDFFTIGTKAKDGNDYIVYDGKKGLLSYDADGAGKGKAILFAKLKAGLEHKDFFVI
jgi:Ca2+-binding RTX toxin-like protein